MGPPFLFPRLITVFSQVALCACPQGDVSLECGEDFPEEMCHPLKVQVNRSWKLPHRNVQMKNNFQDLQPQRNDPLKMGGYEQEARGVGLTSVFIADDVSLIFGKT